MLREMVLLAAAALSFFSTPVSAHWIALDSRFGPQTITLDTHTGLEWLDISVSDNLSSREVEQGFRSGGFLEGFRYATGAELCGLTTSFFGVDRCNDVLKSGWIDYTKTTQFIYLFGDRGFDDFGCCARGSGPHRA
ncbi:MAG: hypothetical protein ACM3SV_01315 [Betaproteobacteria bacterium]